jgi:hypothetical protein
MAKPPKDQLENMDNESNAPSDPNIVGKPETQTIQDRRAGTMTACQEYDQNEPFYSAKVRR